MAWPAPSPGRPLEAEGDLRSRGMTILARIRLKGLLGLPCSSERPSRPYKPRNCKEDLADASIRWHRGGGGGDRRVWWNGGRAEPEPVADTYRVTDAIPVPVPVSDTREHLQGR